MTRIAPALPFTLALAVALAAASCATTADVAEQADGPLRIEGTIASIDLQPWTYDGNASTVSTTLSATCATMPVWPGATSSAMV